MKKIEYTNRLVRMLENDNEFYFDTHLLMKIVWVKT